MGGSQVRETPFLHLTRSTDRRLQRLRHSRLNTKLQTLQWIDQLL